jgi:hypothetical protein
VLAEASPRLPERLCLAVAVAQLALGLQALLVAVDRVVPAPLVGVDEPEVVQRVRLAVAITCVSCCVKREL